MQRTDKSSRRDFLLHQSVPSMLALVVTLGAGSSVFVPCPVAAVADDTTTVGGDFSILDHQQQQDRQNPDDSSLVSTGMQSEDGDDEDIPFVYSKDWTGTRLPLLTLPQAVQSAFDKNANSWPMGRWPDPILRRPAAPVASAWFGTETLQKACKLLEKTAQHEEAVGLAAQQCGVDARIVYLQTSDRQKWWRRDLDDSSTSRNGLVMINPRIVNRSEETKMKIWQEHCLVLPPSFVATVLRDAWIDIDYQDWRGEWHYNLRLSGELARAAQHELDHDRGILVTDHVGMDELENDVMRAMEQKGHAERMLLAYSRSVQDHVRPSLL